MRDLDATSTSTLSDADLLRRSAKDSQAFGVFYDRHVEAVLRYVVGRTGSGELAAEITAETFARAYIHRRRFRDLGSSARPWLLGIARNLLAHTLRRQAVTTRALRRLAIPRLEVDDPSLERIEELFDSAPMRALLKEVMAELSPPVSEALFLRIGQDLPYTEVAARLGCTVGAARVRVARGLTALANKLGGDNE